jgi:hypothetical protein
VVIDGAMKSFMKLTISDRHDVVADMRIGSFVVPTLFSALGLLATLASARTSQRKMEISIADNSLQTAGRAKAPCIE